MKIAPISNALFIRNRTRLAEMLEPGSVALVGSNSRKFRNGDQFYPYRQHSDFFYLTGINQQESVLLISPDQKEGTFREILFLKKPTSKSILWTGPGLTESEATLLSGIDQVKALEELDHFMGKLFPGGGVLYTSGDFPLPRISEQFPDINITSLSANMVMLRRVKEPEELEEIRKACNITRSAFGRILPLIKPGIWECEIEAEIIAEFIGRGANGPAFEPIVASGKNTLILHYVENKDQCREGELVLLDFGAEVNNYASDCSRTVPVNGCFSKRQREVYDALARVFRQARELIVPGTLMADFHKGVGELWQEEHIALGLYSQQEAKNRQGGEPIWKDYFMHGTSHSMGLDVHDPCDRSIPFESGMVITCEPAIYIKEEGFGIRLENDILITPQGPVDLMEDIPMEAAEIEEIMQSK